MAKHPQMLFILGLFQLCWTALSDPPEDCKESDEKCDPEQLHLTYCDKTNDITVTCSSLTDIGEKMLKFNSHSKNKNRVPSHRIVLSDVDKKKKKKKQWINIVKLKNLKDDTVYKVESKHGWSNLMKFKTPPPWKYQTQTIQVFEDTGDQKRKFNMSAHMAVKTKKGQCKPVFQGR